MDNDIPDDEVLTANPALVARFEKMLEQAYAAGLEDGELNSRNTDLVEIESIIRERTPVISPPQPIGRKIVRLVLLPLFWAFVGGIVGVGLAEAWNKYNFNNATEPLTAKVVQVMPVHNMH